MKTVICLSGKRNSGKTTAEQFILKHLDGAATSYQMATLLKKVISALTGITPKELDRQEFKKFISPYVVYNGSKKHYLTYRELLIHFGKKLREDDNDIFIKDVIKYIEHSNSPCIVIPDVREVREMQALEEYCDDHGIQFVALRIERPKAVLNDNISNDKTEVDLDDYDFNHTILNDGSMNDLHHNLYLILHVEGITLKNFYEQNLF